MIDSLIEKLKLLRLKAFAENLLQVIETAEHKNWPAPEMLEHLADLELELRTQNRISCLYFSIKKRLTI